MIENGQVFEEKKYPKRHNKTPGALIIQHFRRFNIFLQISFILLWTDSIFLIYPSRCSLVQMNACSNSYHLSPFLSKILIKEHSEFELSDQFNIYSSESYT